VTTFRGIAAIVVAASLVASAARAEGLGQPTAEVILTVSGAISVTNVDGEAHLDRAMVEALPVAEFSTSTIWTDGEHVFTGVPLSDLLAHVGAEGTTLRATAINDYTVEIPVADAVPGGPVVAYRMDGAPMSVRDKGPLWIVYPYDASADYRNEIIYSRSIWQLNRIEVVR
jgi:hypothetical protein